MDEKLKEVKRLEKKIKQLEKGNSILALATQMKKLEKLKSELNIK